MCDCGIIAAEGSVEILYGTGTKKMLNLMILKILEKYSDAEHCLTQKRIIELLDLEYGMECNRRSVATNIDSLKEMGYDIVKEKRGVYIIREFEDWELRVLIDSVLFSKTISQSKAKQLIEKIQTLSNKYFTAKVKHIVNLPELHRSDNKNVAFALNALNDAINSNKKIKFTYNAYGEDLKLHPKREEPYVASPYQMVAANDHYYLIANTDGHDNFSHYRVDKMTNVRILEDAARPIREFAPGGFNLPKHMAEHIYMFSGKSNRVKFWTYGYLLDALVDWFGKDFDIVQHDGDRLLISVRVNLQAMKYWALQFGEHVEIVEPQVLRDEIRNIAENIRTAHEDPAEIDDKQIDVPSWMKEPDVYQKPSQSKIVMFGAGNFGADIVENLKSRSIEELEFIDEVDFISLGNDELQRTSETVVVRDIKFTVWGFDPEIQRRLENSDLILIAADENSFKDVISFVEAVKTPKIFFLPEANHLLPENTAGNVFVNFPVENFSENIYAAVRGFRDLMIYQKCLGFDFFNLDEILNGNIEEFYLRFGEAAGENSELKALKTAFNNLPELIGGICSITANLENFSLRAARDFINAQNRNLTLTINADETLGDTIRVMILANKLSIGLKIVAVGENLPAVDDVQIISAENLPAKISADIIFVVADNGAAVDFARNVDAKLKILFADEKSAACNDFDVFFIGCDAEKIIREFRDFVMTARIVTLDFAYVCAVLKNSGEAVALIGEGKTIFDALNAALKTSDRIQTARSILVKFTSPKDLASISDVNTAASVIQEIAVAEANIFWTIGIGEKFSATIIATNFAKEEA